MQTDVFNTFKTNASSVLGHINALDLCLQIYRESISAYQQKLEHQAKNTNFRISGIRPEDEEKYSELFGVVTVTVSEAHKLANSVMLTSCKNSLVPLIAVVEDYLQGICAWIFSKQPNILRSEKKLTLSYKEVIELGSYDALMRKVMIRVMNDITRDNVADSFRNIFADVFKWDISAQEKGLVVLKDSTLKRNIVVHNQSKVNGIFLSKVSNPGDYVLEQEISIKPDELRDCSYSIINLIRELDALAFAKCAR